MTGVPCKRVQCSSTDQHQASLHQLVPSMHSTGSLLQGFLVLLLLFFVWDLLMDHFQQLLRQEGLFLCHLATAAVAELGISVVGAADRSLHVTATQCSNRTDPESFEKGHTDMASDTVTSLN